jgi:hypothetical protein
MSGRLIILPKKSYCPWNPRNVQRVLRDEEAHAAAEEQEAKKQKFEETRRRTKLSGEEKLEHVNLFLQEEKDKELETSHRELSPGHLHFRHSAAESMNKGSEQITKDESLKSNMDPMKSFCVKKSDSNSRDVQRQPLLAQEYDKHGAGQCSESKRRKKKRSKLSRRRSSTDSDTESSSSIGSEWSLRRQRNHKRKRKKRSRHRREETQRPVERDVEIQELRLRRAQREERERQRQARLM